jgi:acyl-CoA thioesterase YciA
MEPEQSPTTEPVIRTIAMPADTNPSGDIFGGWLMAQMDLAAGNLAGHVARGRAATIAVEGMVFHRPVKVGDEVSLYADLISTGRSSIKIHVQAWRRSRYGDLRTKVTDATFTFVALDAEGKSRPLPTEQA